MKAEEALLAIQELMSGVEWCGDTLEEIAKIMELAGYPLQDIE